MEEQKKENHEFRISVEELLDRIHVANQNLYDKNGFLLKVDGVLEKNEKNDNALILRGENSNRYIQLLNNYHSQLKGMIDGRFNGIAMKYLNNYLVYHNRL